MTTEKTERLHSLDAVRAIALLLGVLFHAAFAYLPGPDLWPVTDSDRSPALAVFVFASHSFRMTTFFLIAGFFAHMSLHRRGVKGFVGDRLKRIALPLVVAWPFVIASVVAVTIWSYLAAHPAVAAGKAPAPPAPPFSLATFPLTHLWFLYVLLLFYVTLLVARGALVAVDRQGGLRRGLDGCIGGIVRIAWPAALAAPLAAAFFVEPSWRAWFGVPTPDTGFVPSIPAVLAFGGAFGLGYMIHRQAELLSVLRRRWGFHLLLGVLCASAALALIGPTPTLVPIADKVSLGAYTICYALAVWSLTFALVGFALRFLAGRSAVRRYLADASYWIYIVHLPLVMALQAALVPLAQPWWVKFPVLLVVAFLIMLGSYQLLVRHSFIGGILNGPRPSRRAAAKLEAAPTGEPA